MKTTTPEQLHTHTTKQLDRLQKRFQGIVAFLKKTTIHKLGKKIRLAKLPWYLFIGPSGAGKTTLLANSHINFILAKHYKPETIQKLLPSQTCDWWITRDLVIIDVPSEYSTTDAAPIWEYLLTSIKNSVRKNTLQGILIALNLPELVKEQHTEEKIQLITDLKKQILELKEKFGKDLPCHLIITKCDFLPGFIEFFSECSNEELAQAWGITFPPANKNEKWSDTYTRRFNALIKRLNKQLLWRLHQERDPHAKSNIKDFPLQIERLKESIASFLGALALTDSSLRGIYLTCGMPNSQEKQLPYLSSSQHALMTSSLAPTLLRPYFVQQLILHGLAPQDAPLAISPSQTWQKNLAWAASLATIAIATAFLGHNFQESLQLLNVVENDLTRYQSTLAQSNNHLTGALSLLDALQHNDSPNASPISYYSNHAHHATNAIYDETLETIVLPQISHYFEKALATVNEKSPERTYAILQAYLMLNNAEHFQADVMANVLGNLLPKTTDKKTLAKLTDHLHAALIAKKSFALNQDVIRETRQALTNLPNTTLAFVILKNMGENNDERNINLDAHTSSLPIFMSKSVATEIPLMFTAPAFEKIIANEISVAARESLEGNWVLGSRPHYTASQAEINTLTTQVRNQYITNYIDIWESLLANLQLVTPTTLAETDATIVSLTSDHSPLLDILQTIKDNTSFALITRASPKLQALNVMLAAATENQPSKLYPIFINLKQLHAYLKAITNTPKEDHAALRLVAQNLQHATSNPITQLHLLADQTPDPMKNWLNIIANQSQKFMTEKFKENA